MVCRNCQHSILATWLNNDPQRVKVSIDKTWIYDPRLGFLALMCEASEVFRAAGSALKNRHHIPSRCALHTPATLFWKDSFKSMQQLPSETAHPEDSRFVPPAYITPCTIDREIFEIILHPETNCCIQSRLQLELFAASRICCLHHFQLHQFTPLKSVTKKKKKKQA